MNEFMSDEDLEALKADTSADAPSLQQSDDGQVVQVAEISIYA